MSGADVTTYKIRITAIDKAGAPVGDVAGHTTVAVTGAFTLYDAPVAATSVTGSDDDGAEAGVDWHDFHATWTVSTSAHIVSQRVFLLPAAQTLNLTTVPLDVPVATYANNSTAVWDSTSSLTVDSRGAPLAAGSYKIWIVVNDPAARVATEESAAFPVAAP